jgi:tetratricopeptide (TPR) repeat protein
MDKGLLLRQQGKLVEAVSYYHKVLENNPNSSSACYHLGLLYYYLSDPTQATHYLRRAVELEPDNISYCYNYAVILQHRGCWQPAVEYYEKTINLGEKDLSQCLKMVVNSYINWGIISFKQELFQPAITLFEKAITLKPDSAILYHNLAQVFAKIDHISGAIAHYKKALELEPDLVLANYNLGKLLVNYRQKGADQYFNKILSIDPDAIYIYADLGNYFLQSGQFAEAFTAWQKLVDNHTFIDHYLALPRDLTSDDQLTLAQYNVRKFIEALKSFDGSVLAISQCCQYLANNYWYVGEALRSDGEDGVAISYYYRAIALQPLEIKFYLSLADCLWQEKRWSGAVLIAHLAKKIEPNHPAVLEYLNRLSTSQLTNNLVVSQTSNRLCAGLNCQACLNKIYLAFAPVYLGKNLYQVIDAHSSANSHTTFGTDDFKNINTNIDVENTVGAIHELPLLPWGENMDNYPAVTHLSEGRAWHVAQVNHWLVCSSLAIINQADQLVNYLCREYPGKLPNCQYYQNFLTDQAVNYQHRFYREKDLGEPTKIKGKVAVITGLSANVYFHWFVDILPRFLILQEEVDNWQSIDYFLINSHQASFQRETLQILGIPPEKILESDRYSSIQAEELIVPKFAGDLGWLSGKSLTALRQTFLPAVNQFNQLNESEQNLPKRIYLSRQGAKHRSVLNEAGVISILEQYGFTVLHLEKLTVLEQIKIFAQAEIIVGPHGSALTNIIFCQAGTKIVELVSPVYMRPYYWVISQYLNLDHYYLLGENFDGYALRQLIYENPLTEDLLINLEYLERTINYLLKKVTNSSQVINRLNDSMNNVLADTKSQNLSSDETVISDQPKLVSPNHQISQAISLLINDTIGPLDPKMNSNVIADSLIMGQTGTAIHQDHQSGESEKVQSLLQKARSWLAEKQFTEAQASCQAAMDLAPNYAPIYKTLGNVQQAAGDLVEAWQSYQRAIALQPDYGEAYANLGTICAQKYQWQEAIAYYEKALSLQPNLEAVRRNLARAKARLNDHSSNDQSHDQMKPDGEKPRKEKIVIGSPTSGLQTPAVIQPVADQLADINANINSDNNEYVDLANNALASYKVLGDLLQEKGKPEEAWQWYQKAIALAPQDPEIYVSVGNLYTHQGQWQEAIKCYQKSLTLVPNYAPAYRQLAQLLTNLGRWDDAAKCWYQAYAFSPETATAEEHFILGNTLLQMNRGQEAVTAYCRAIELNPHLAGVYEQLGVALKTVEATDKVAGKTINQTLHLNQTINQARNLSPAMIANMDDKANKKGFIQNTLASIDRLWQGLFKKNSKTSQGLTEQDLMGEKAGLLATDINSVSDELINSQQSGKMKQEDYQYYGNEGLINTYWQFTGSPQRLEILPVNPQPTFSPVAKITPMMVNRVNWQNSQPNIQQNITSNIQLTGNLPNNSNDINLLPHDQNDDGKILGILKPEEKSGVVSTVKIPQTNVQSTVPKQTPTAQLFLQIAEIYYRQAKYQEAIAQCDQALAIDDRSADAYMIKGNAWLALGNLGEAEKAYRQSLHSQPENAVVYSNLGTVYAQQKLWSRAIASWQKAISVKSDFAAAYRNLGKAWGQIGRLAESADCWYQAYSYEPAGVTADQYLYLANLLTEQGQITQAIDCYERAIQLDSQLLGAYQGICLLLQQQGKWQEAEVYGQRFRELGGNMPAVMATPREPVAINSQKSLAHPTDILVQKQSAVASIDPENTVTNDWRKKASLAIKQGDLAGAIACYQELIKVDSQSVAGHYNLGQIYRSQKRWSEAIACYQQALQIFEQQGIQPDLNIQVWEIYQNLGDVYQENGDVDEAITAYQQALDLSND